MSTELAALAGKLVISVSMVGAVSVATCVLELIPEPLTVTIAFNKLPPVEKVTISEVAVAR